MPGAEPQELSPTVAAHPNNPHAHLMSPLPALSDFALSLTFALSRFPVGEYLRLSYGASLAFTSPGGRSPRITARRIRYGESIPKNAERPIRFSAA